ISNMFGSLLSWSSCRRSPDLDSPPMTVVVKTDRDGIPGFGPARAGLRGRDRWKHLAIQHHLLDPWRTANYEDQIARSRLVAAGRSRNVDHGSGRRRLVGHCGAAHGPTQ